MSRLCGSQPLSVEQLRRFLEIVATAVRFSIQNKINRWRQDKISVVTEAAGTADVACNHLETEKLSDGKVSPAGINFLTAAISPETVDRKLRILSQLERSDQLGANWFGLWEFTDATPQEIAKYYACTEKEVLRLLDVWLSDFRTVKASATE